MDREEYIILVDEQDNPLGKMEKLEAHQKGLLHRAFSVFIFNSRGEMLLQQRADTKYHSAGLWTNACCSHPNYGESMERAVNRRLQQEMGLNLRPEFIFSFIYKVRFNNGLIENEFDHVYSVISDSLPEPNKEEVKSWKYANVDLIRKEISENPSSFTEWFRLSFEKVIRYMDGKNSLNV